MQLFLLTDRQDQAKLIQWKATDIKQMKKAFLYLLFKKEKMKVSFLDQSISSLTKSKRKQICKGKSSLCTAPTCRFTKRKFLICLTKLKWNDLLTMDQGSNWSGTNSIFSQWKTFIHSNVNLLMMFSLSIILVLETKLSLLITWTMLVPGLILS